MEEVEYARLLDGLVSFYNSDFSVHVGYELTATTTMLIFDCTWFAGFFQVVADVIIGTDNRS
jgi:hypothetical protein